MDEDDILIEVKLDDREITRQMNTLASKLQKSLNAALGGNASGGNTGAVTRAIKDQEAAALRLAQAQARLATASGDLSKAQNILNTALAGVNKTTVASIGAQTQLAQVHNRMSRTLKDMADTLQNIGSRLTIGLTLPLAALAGAAIKTAVDFDSLKRGLISVSGSAEAADKQLAKLKETAKLPGLSFREAVQGSINLQAAGFSADRAEKALRVFGNALATVGKGSSELQGVITALTQIESKGKVSAEEINQLAERVPQIRRAIIAAFGTADTEIIQKAKITSRQFIDAVTTELDKLPKVTGGAKNTFENLKDSIEQSLLPLGNKLLETILPAIEKLAPKLLGLLEGFQKLSPEVQTFAIGLGAAAIAAGPLISALGNMLFLLTQIRNLGGVTSVLGAAGGGLGRFLATPLGAGLGAGGAAAGAAALGVFLADRELQRRVAAEQQTFQLKLGNRPLLDPEASKQEEALLAQFAAAKGLPATGQLDFRRGIREFNPMTGGLSPQSPANSPTIDAKKLAQQNAKRQGAKTELEKAIADTKQITDRVKALGDERSKLFQEEFKQEVQRLKEEEALRKLRNQAFRQFLTSQGRALPPELPNVGITDAQRRAIPLLAAPGSPGGITGSPTIAFRADLDADRAGAARTRTNLADQRLRTQEAQIQNQINRGILTEAEAQKQLNAARRASRDELIASLEVEMQSAGVNSVRGLQITEEIERLRLLGVELSSTERFMRGFNSQIQTVGDAFDRFGQNVSRAFGNVRDLFNGLKQAVLGFFNDLLGSSIQNLARSVLAPIFGGGSSGGGILGNIFRTPSFAGGGGIATPPSISQSLLGIGFGQGFGIAGGGASSGGLGDFIGASVPRTAGQIASRGFSGFNFGQIGQSLANAAPLLGLSIGASLGGKSIGGNILGAAGGLLTSTFISTTLGAPGALGSLAPALFSNPITAIAGAGLLVGAVLLGKAKQRKQDEQASGEFLTQALQGIDQLATGIATDQIEGKQARAIFDSQILNPFRQQISGLKTKSVVESRLKNQVNDLNNVYRDRIEPLIADQEKRRNDQARFAALDRRLVPQFEIGGITSGGLALLHPNEMVLTRGHQANIQAIAGPDIFERVGVPGVQPNRVFDDGGIMPSFGGGGQTVVIEKIVLFHGMSESGAEELVAVGMSSRNGQRIVANALEAIRTRRTR